MQCSRQSFYVCVGQGRLSCQSAFELHHYLEHQVGPSGAEIAVRCGINGSS